MPIQKKRIDKNTETTESRPLDSYFGSKKTSNIAIQNVGVGVGGVGVGVSEVIPVNITSLELIPPAKSNSPTSRECILNNLKSQKIIYNFQYIIFKIGII